MRTALFCHSLISDWNHGNAHFLRGITADLLERGHDVRVYEPADAWSVQNLISEYGDGPLEEFAREFPDLRSFRYDLAGIDLDTELDGVDLVLVHEWNSHDLVRRIGEWRNRNPRARLLFHDTHHRSVTDPGSMAAYDLRYYDGVLAFGEVIRRIYIENGWAARAWTWHEAADTRVFRPRAPHRECDLVWIGNWGDDERTAELHKYLLEPVHVLGLNARVHGVRYPQHALESLAAAGIDYAGWIPNYLVPEAFAHATVTVHVPRRPYAEALPGIPTIRPFEAMACGIPLVCSPWNDTEGLFREGQDYLLARNGEEMKRHLTDLLYDDALRAELKMNGLERILSRHTCTRRVTELLEIYDAIAPPSRRKATLTEAAR